MKALVIGAACLAALAGSAAAETKYDRKLEQAVLEIVAKKFRADLRGTFDFNREPVFIVVQDQMSTGSLGVPAETVQLESTLPLASFAPPPRTVSRVVYF